MKISWYPNRDLQFLVLRKKGHQLRYIGKGSTHTPGTLCTVPLGVINCLEKLTLCKPIFHSERVENVYRDHMEALREVGLIPPIFLKMGELWKVQDEKMDIEKKREPGVNKKKYIYFLCSIVTLFFYIYPTLC